MHSFAHILRLYVEYIRDGEIDAIKCEVCKSVNENSIIRESDMWYNCRCIIALNSI